MPGAVFTYGRFNPPTKGHMRVIDDVIKRAKATGATPYIVTTHTEDPKKNPLPHWLKMKILKAKYPEVRVLGTSRKAPTPHAVVRHLLMREHSDVRLVLGSNRVKTFEKMLGGKEQVTVVGVERNAQGISATKAREAARSGNFKKFQKLFMLNKNPIFTKMVYDRIKRNSV